MFGLELALLATRGGSDPAGPALSTATGGQERGAASSRPSTRASPRGWSAIAWTVRAEVGVTIGLTSPFPLTTFELGGGIRF